MSGKLKILHSKITSDKGSELLILHGFLGMGDNWKTYANVMTKLGYRTHLIDQRNHGKSFWSNQFSYSIMAEDIINYCKYHKLEKVFILVILWVARLLWSLHVIIHIYLKHSL